MDQRDDFSKWISTVEEALSGNLPSGMPTAPVSECGECGNWDCATCFPDANDAEIEIDPGMEITMMPDEQEHSCPDCGYPNNGHNHDEEEFGIELEDGSGGGMGAAGMAQVPMEEEEEEFIEKGSSGRGVKLGDIVSKTEFRKTGGQNSPLTYGEDNLDEDDGTDEYSDQDFANDQQDFNGRYTPTNMGIGDGHPAAGMIDGILNMQDMGMSMDNREYSMDELEQMANNREQIEAVYNKVMGKVTEAPKPTTTKPQHDMSGFDDMDDILNPRQGNLPANVDPEMDQDMTGEPGAMELPTASASSTQRATQNVSPSNAMRELMSRMDRSIGDAEPDMPHAENELVVRTANEVPAVISSAMRASGTESPEWHRIKNLPGMNDRAIRAMGRGLFGTMTSTPVEEIKTIANVGGQGPNTESEVRSVAAWLKNNAEDLGDVQVSHGAAMPGYEVDAHDFRTNGVRFHVVRDQAGTYIYAYPDKDAKVQGQAQGHLGMGGNTPQLGESISSLILKPSLFEQIKWDEELAEELVNESSLSKLIGKEKGGQKLVQWLHRKHQLGNDADLQPAPFSTRMLWKEYKRNPDNFIVVTAENGVAGIKPYKKYIDDRTAAFAKKGKSYDPGGDSTLPYQIIAFTDDGEQVDPALLRPTPADGETRDVDPTVTRARMGLHNGKDMQNPDNAFNLLADQIGRLVTVYVASGAVERDKIKSREKPEQKIGAAQDSMAQILKRVRPVMKTLANQAMSQVQKTAQRYMNGGNFEGAQKIIQGAAKLKQVLVNLDTGSDIALDANFGSATRDFTNAITRAIEKASGSPQGTPEFAQWADEAAKGSTVALKPVLDGLREVFAAMV